MTDTANDPLAFAPVRSKRRADGWTAERQRRFVQVLAERGCVSEAAQAVGLSPRSAYRLRARPDAAAFHRAWDAALVMGSERLTTLAFERAVHGTVRQVWHKGELVGEERVPSERLLMFLLTHLDPMRFSALGRAQLPLPDPRRTARDSLAGLVDALDDNDEPAVPLGAEDFGAGRPPLHAVPPFDSDDD